MNAACSNLKRHEITDMVASGKGKKLCFQSGTSVANEFPNILPPREALRSGPQWQPHPRLVQLGNTSVLWPISKTYQSTARNVSDPSKTRQTPYGPKKNIIVPIWMAIKLLSWDPSNVHCTNLAPGKKLPAALLDKDRPSCQCSGGEVADHDHSGTLNLDWIWLRGCSWGETWTWV